MLWESKNDNISKQQKLFVELSHEEDQIVNIIKQNKETSIDHIVLASKITNSKVAAILLNLELKGVIKSLPGKIYKYY